MNAILKTLTAASMMFVFGSNMAMSEEKTTDAAQTVTQENCCSETIKCCDEAIASLEKVIKCCDSEAKDCCKNEKAVKCCKRAIKGLTLTKKRLENKTKTEVKNEETKPETK